MAVGRNNHCLCSTIALLYDPTASFTSTWSSLVLGRSSCGLSLGFLLLPWLPGHCIWPISLVWWGERHHTVSASCNGRGMNSPQLCHLITVRCWHWQKKWTDAYNIRREESMDMNSDLPYFQTGRKPGGHPWPLLSTAHASPDGSQI